MGSDTKGPAARREAHERARKVACDRDCTAESLIAAAREARARGDKLAGIAPFSTNPKNGNKIGYIFCETHLFYVPIEYGDAPIEPEKAHVR